MVLTDKFDERSDCILELFGVSELARSKEPEHCSKEDVANAKIISKLEWRFFGLFATLADALKKR